MFIRVSAVIAVFTTLLFFTGCDGAQNTTITTAPSPTSQTQTSKPGSIQPGSIQPGGMSTSAAPPIHTIQSHRSEVTVRMHDNCDPETFNARLGPGTCAGPGGLRFDNFIAELTRNH